MLLQTKKGWIIVSYLRVPPYRIFLSVLDDQHCYGQLDLFHKAACLEDPTRWIRWYVVRWYILGHRFTGKLVIILYCTYLCVILVHFHLSKDFEYVFNPDLRVAPGTLNVAMLSFWKNMFVATKDTFLKIRSINLQTAVLCLYCSSPKTFFVYVYNQKSNENKLGQPRKNIINYQ